MGIRTNLLKANFDAKRREEYPTVSAIYLQALNDTTREYETYRTIYSGWMMERIIVDFVTGQRQPVLKITNNAVTDGTSSVITSDEIMYNLAAVLIGGVRYECRNPQPPTKEPAYFSVEIEMLRTV